MFQSQRSFSSSRISMCYQQMSAAFNNGISSQCFKVKGHLVVQGSLCAINRCLQPLQWHLITMFQSQRSFSSSRISMCYQQMSAAFNNGISSQCFKVNGHLVVQGSLCAINRCLQPLTMASHHNVSKSKII